MGEKAFHVLLVLALILCGVPALMAGIYFMGRINGKYAYGSAEYQLHSRLIGCTGGVLLVAIFILGKILVERIW